MKSYKKSSAKSRPRGRPTHTALVARDENPWELPQIQDQLCVGMTLRFVTTDSFTGSFAVSVGNLLDAMLIAGTATNAYQLFDFVKLKRVTIRGMGLAVQGAIQIASSCTVAVEFFGIQPGSQTGGKQKSNTQIGNSMPAFVSLKPDPRSQAAQFQANSTNALFVVRAVDANANPMSGCVIDVDVVYRNSADVNPAAPGTARAAMQPGTIYFGGLDGATDAATHARSTFVPRI